MAEEKMVKSDVSGAGENSETYDRMPLIGDKAPAFRTMTTMGKCNFPDDYRRTGGTKLKIFRN